MNEETRDLQQVSAEAVSETISAPSLAPPPPPADIAAAEVAVPDETAPAAAAVETEIPQASPASDLIHYTADGEPEYPRFRLMARTEHMTLLISFTILCLTGLPQKFPFSPLSQGLIALLGGIEVVRMIHRWSAVVLILGTIYHLLTSAYRLFVKHEDMRMLPDLKDGFDLRDTVAYNLGLIDEPPKMRKFNFGEKFEYWAVVWGTGVMIATGFILWNPIAATRILPGSYIPVALIAHGWEAVLAAVSIVIWHLYNVLVKHRNKSMFTGTLSHKIMEEEHALELERLDAGGDPWKVIPPDVLARRRKIYFAVAGIVVIMAAALVIWMFTFEDTAIIVVPQATRDVFVPLATPIP
ncbi:MAG: cytochrome b/b6 domain-containing protein [Candidatus Promineofilum sp.]|nr:cytochrome b/b6 domain-containing protein [Promineifilum sp.]